MPPVSPCSSDLRLEAALAELPLIAILRGIPTSDVIDVLHVLFDAGVRVAEIPLNSPTPFDSIRAAVACFGDRMVIGAGTVTTPEEVNQLSACGGLICVSPNSNVEVIRTALGLGLTPIPGFQTATEAFRALDAGASYLKLFPAQGRLDDLSALKAVLPHHAKVIAVGGVTPQNTAALRRAGALAVGAGSDLYRPGYTTSVVRSRAEAWAATFGQPNAKRRVDVACQAQAQVGESPMWHPPSKSVLWVDLVSRTLYRHTKSTERVQTLPVDGAITAIRELRDGQIAASLEDGLALLDPFTGGLDRGPIAPVEAGCRFNDMAVAPSGAIWVGSMHKGLLATRGGLYRANGVGAPCLKVASGLGVPNGMAFSSDGQTLYLVDTLSRTLLAYSVMEEAPWVSEPRVITDFMGLPGKPDGMCIAPDGTLLVAMWGGGCVAQIDPNGGACTQTIEVPAPQVSSVCMDSSMQVYVSTSRMRLSQRQLMDSPLSGSLFVVDL